MGVVADYEQRLKALMLRGQAGDAAAWRELLAVLARQLRGYFARRLGPAHAPDVEDLVQETLLAVHNRRMTYDPTQPFTAWTHAMARYKLIDFWRRRRLRVHVALDDVADLLWTEADPMAAELADLQRAMAGLPDKQRALIHEVKIEGLSLAEAGARRGMTEGAAKVGLHRAIKALTARMRGLADG